jgi:hypothetical protein
MLPFHVLEKSKEQLCPDTIEQNKQNFDNYTRIGGLFMKFRDNFKNCLYDPTSPQGLLLFGAISSAYAIKYNSNLITV